LFWLKFEEEGKEWSGGGARGREVDMI